MLNFDANAYSLEGFGGKFECIILQLILIGILTISS